MFHIEHERASCRHYMRETYIQGKHKPELSVRLFSSAALRFINRKLVVYISVQGKAKFEEENISSHRPADKVRERMSFISLLRPGGKYCLLLPRHRHLKQTCRTSHTEHKAHDWLLTHVTPQVGHR